VHQDHVLERKVSWAHSYCKKKCTENRFDTSCELKIWTQFKACHVSVPKLVEQISVFTEATLVINKSERGKPKFKSKFADFTYIYTLHCTYK